MSGELYDGGTVDGVPIDGVEFLSESSDDLGTLDLDATTTLPSAEHQPRPGLGESDTQELGRLSLPPPIATDAVDTDESDPTPDNSFRLADAPREMASARYEVPPPLASTPGTLSGVKPSEVIDFSFSCFLFQPPRPLAGLSSLSLTL